MIHIDLEFVWKDWARRRELNSAGHSPERPTPIKDYLLRFPELMQPRIVSRLLRQELRVRRECGDREAADQSESKFTQIGITRFRESTEAENSKGTGPIGAVAPAFLQQLRECDLLPSEAEVQANQATMNTALGHTILKPAATPPAAPVAVTAESVLFNPAAPAAGMQLGQYRLVKKLGEGGMGAVWQAVHQRLRKTVAIKLLSAHLLRDPALVARFEREMEAIGKVEHPHLVRAYDAGEDHGTHFLVMEFIDGVDLAHHIKRQGPLPLNEALECLRQAALGLEEAHRVGLVHRDIKPGNLMLTGAGQVKVTDLGLARLQVDITSPLEPQTLTSAGQILGTPDFMAPEQWDNTHQVDARCDLYALGCTLFYLLTGRAPFSDQTTLAKKLQAHGTLPPPDLQAACAAIASPSDPATVAWNDPPRVLPTQVVVLYEKLMAKRPEDRYQSARELITAISVAQSCAKTEVQSPSGVDDTFAVITADASNPPPRKGRRRSPAMMLGACAVMVLLAGIIIVIRKSDGTTVKIPVAKGDKVEIVASDETGDPAPPSPDLKVIDVAKERAVAEWLLSIDGTVDVVLENGKPQRLSRGALPEVPFSILKILLNHNPNVSDEDLKRVAQLPQLRELSLTQSRKITDEGMKNLSQAPRLTSLTIDATNVTDGGVAELSKISTLIHLRASSCPVSIVGLRSLSNLPLTLLTVGTGSSKVQMSDLPEIVTIFPNLGFFDGRLSGNSDLGLSPLSKLPRLGELIIRQQELIAGDPHQLAACRQLKMIQLYKQKIPATAFQQLAQIPQVSELTLLTVDMDEAAVDQLSAISTIQQLTIDTWSGTDPQLLKLASMTGLRTLSLKNCKISPDGTKRFHELRPDVAIDGDFKIPAVAKTPNYAKERAVAEWVLSIGGTVDVVVENSKPQRATKDSLPESPFVLRKISLIGNAKVTNSDLRQLVGLSDLDELELAVNPQLTDAATEFLSQVGSLRGLDLNSARLSDDGMTRLAKLPVLARLGIDATGVTDVGLAELAKMPSLRSLNATSCPVSIVGLRSLARLPMTNLAVVSGHSKVQLTDLAEIVTLFPHLKSFDGRLKGSSAAGLSPLAKLSDLEDLLVHPSDLVAGEPHRLASFPQLRRLRTYDREISAATVSQLRDLPRVEEILFQRARLNEDALNQLAATPTIQRVSLYDWSGGDVDLLKLVPMTGLRSLVLLNTKVSAEGAKKFHELRSDVAIGGNFKIPAVPKTPNYAKEREVAEWVLSVGGQVDVVVGKGAVQHLSQGPVPTGPAVIRFIRLDKIPQITDADLNRFADLSDLQSLSLAQNPQLTDHGFGEVAWCPTLRSLNLSNTPFGDLGIASISRLSNLSSLTMQYAAVTDQGIAQLQRVSSLRTLFLLNAKNVSIEGLRSLADVPLTNLTIADGKFQFADLPDIVATFPNLIGLDVRGLRGESQKGFAPLANLKQLQTMTISSRMLAAGDPYFLESVTQVKNLAIQYEKALQRNCLTELARLPHVQRLNFTSCEFSRETLDQLAQAEFIQYLSFEGGSLSDADIRVLASMKGLRTLGLAKTQVSAEGANQFQELRPDVAIRGDFNLPAKAK